MPQTPTVPWREVAVFLGVTFLGVTVAVMLAVLGGHDLNARSSGTALFLGAAMLTPTLGVLAATASSGALWQPKKLLAETGVLLHRPFGRAAGYSALGLVLPPALAVAALGLSAAAGTFLFDGSLTAGDIAAPIGMALLILPPALVLMLGEEWAWRGYLLPRLLPLGLVPALLASGVIWGLFHAPATLNGYAFPDASGSMATLFFTIGCVVEGCLLGWLRLASRSVWPAVVAHGAGNMLASQLADLLGDPANPVNAQFTAAPTGWSGWLATGTFVAVVGAIALHRRRICPPSPGRTSQAPPQVTAPTGSRRHSRSPEEPSDQGAPWLLRNRGGAQRQRRN